MEFRFTIKKEDVIVKCLFDEDMDEIYIVNDDILCYLESEIEREEEKLSDLFFVLKEIRFGKHAISTYVKDNNLFAKGYLTIDLDDFDYYI